MFTLDTTQIITGLLVAAACMLFNRARGSRLYEETDSTEAGRLVSMGLMALCVGALELPDWHVAFELFCWTYISLMLWCTPAWDKYWSEEIGNDPDHSRLYGLACMTARQALFVPVVVGDALILGHLDRAVYAGVFVLMGLPYYVYGFINKAHAVEFSEFTDGAIIGCTLYALTL